MKRLKIFIVDAYLISSNMVLRLLKKVFWANKNIVSEHIIIYKVGNIGDIITAYPAIKAIRHKFPNAKIDLLTSSGSLNNQTLASSAHILKEQNLVDNIIYYYSSDVSFFGLIKLVKKLRGRKYDVGVIFNEDKSTFLRSLKKLFLFRSLKISYVYSLMINRFKKFEIPYSEKIPYPYINEIDRNLNFVSEIFKINNFERLFHYKEKKLVDNEYIGKIQNYIVIAIGAKFDYKKWDLKNYYEISKLWLKNDGAVIFIGNKNDDVDVKNIIVGLRNSFTIKKQGIDLSKKVINLCNRTSLSESISIIKRAKIMIANDSGPAHLCSLTNTKVISIQSPNNFKFKWDPYFSKELVFRT